MEKKQKASSIFSIVLMGVAAVLIIYCLFTKNRMPDYVTFVIASVANLLALICGIVYTVKGSKKGAATWLKCFEGFAGIALLASVARASSIGNSPVSAVSTTLSFGLLCILCCADNLGKKRSYWIGVILVIAKVVAIIITFASKIKFSMAVNLISQLLILVVLVLLLTQKYRDKEARGTK